MSMRGSTPEATTRRDGNLGAVGQLDGHSLFILQDDFLHPRPGADKAAPGLQEAGQGQGELVHAAFDDVVPQILDNRVEEPGQVTAAGVLGTHIGVAGETAQEEFRLRGLQNFRHTRTRDFAGRSGSAPDLREPRPGGWWPRPGRRGAN